MMKHTALLLLGSLALAACQTQGGDPAATSAAAVPVGSNVPAAIASGAMVEVGGLPLNDVFDLEVLATMTAQVTETARTCAIGADDLIGLIRAVDAAAPVPNGQSKGWVAHAFEAGRKTHHMPVDSAACGPREKEPVLRMVERLRTDLAAPGFQAWLGRLKA